VASGRPRGLCEIMEIEEKIYKWSLENPDSFVLTDKDLCKKLHDSLSREQNAKCPYCNQLKCCHWTGLGWKNPNLNG